MKFREQPFSDAVYCWFFESSKDSIPVGFILYTEDEKSKTLFLEAIEVHPSRRSMGYSKKFLKIIKELSEGYHKEAFSWRGRDNFTAKGLERVAPYLMTDNELSTRRAQRPDILLTSFVKDWENLETYLIA